MQYFDKHPKKVSHYVAKCRIHIGGLWIPLGRGVQSLATTGLGRMASSGCFRKTGMACQADSVRALTPQASGKIVRAGLASSVARKYRGFVACPGHHRAAIERSRLFLFAVIRDVWNTGAVRIRVTLEITIQSTNDRSTLICHHTVSEGVRDDRQTHPHHIRRRAGRRQSELTIRRTARAAADAGLPTS